MVNLTNYNKPSRFDDLFRTFLWQPVRIFDENADLTIKTDVTEDDKAYTVKADIPGVKKEDIAVEINANEAQATYEDGVLHLTLPKESGLPSKQVKVR